MASPDLTGSQNALSRQMVKRKVGLPSHMNRGNLVGLYLYIYLESLSFLSVNLPSLKVFEVFIQP